MPSPAAIKYRIAAQRARVLREAANDRRLGPLSQDHTQIHYHASLAAGVAAWDAYTNNLVRDFFTETSDPFNPKFHALHTVAQHTAERALERFSTPNWENTRNLLAQYTGYDPINDWVWPARGLGGPQVRERLNQILQVRHSFAHGFEIPAYPWTQSATGRVRLTSQALQDTEAFFKNLVERTERGMKQHLNMIYGVALTW
jgi:hypothetical protein